MRICREEFGRGNDFAVKITYRTTGVKPEDLLNQFRNSFNPRIAVTVDMIATGTDVRPLECVMFMRQVRSRNFFEQMKGRGVRIINPDDLQAVSADATAKTHFVLVDAVGVTEADFNDTAPARPRQDRAVEEAARPGRRRQPRPRRRDLASPDGSPASTGSSPPPTAPNSPTPPTAPP